MAREENDDSSLKSIANDTLDLEKTVVDLEFRRMFSNPMDPNNCFLDIQAGSGGTEAQDWAHSLERMYLRYCERKGFKVELLEESPAEVAGIKSASLKITGEYAYGHLRTETGIHRLVRKSPFDSNNRRHTSFASVFVYPEVDDTIEIEINPAAHKVILSFSPITTSLTSGMPSRDTCTQGPPSSAGVSKSGSPTDRLITSLPSAFSALARAVMARVGEGFTRWMRRAICRLTGFPSGLDNGLSKERAASVAKNITVNFNYFSRGIITAGNILAFIQTFN